MVLREGNVLVGELFAKFVRKVDLAEGGDEFRDAQRVFGNCSLLLFRRQFVGAPKSVAGGVEVGTICLRVVDFAAEVVHAGERGVEKDICVLRGLGEDGAEDEGKGAVTLRDG